MNSKLQPCSEPQSEGTAASLSLQRRVGAVVVLSFGTAATIIDSNAPLAALPEIGRALDIDDAAATSIMALYQLVILATLFPFAALSDRLGPRKVYCLGQALFVLSSILCIFVHSFGVLLVVRALQALAASASMSAFGALLRAIYPIKYLGRGLALHTTIVSLAFAAAPSLGGFILSWAPWQYVFACSAPLALAPVVAGFLLPRLEHHNENIDWLSSAICILMICAVGGSLQMEAFSLDITVALLLAVSGMVVGYFFVRRQLQRERPVLPIDLLIRPATGLAVLSGVFAFSSIMLTLIVLPFRLESQYGFSAAEIGLVLAGYPVATMITGPVAGALSDKFRAEIMGFIGALAAAAGLVLLLAPPETVSGPIPLCWRLGVVGAGFAIFLSPNARFIVARAPPGRMASGASLTSLARLSGQTLGAALAAAFLSVGESGAQWATYAAIVLTVTTGGFCAYRAVVSRRYLN